MANIDSDNRDGQLEAEQPAGALDGRGILAAIIGRDLTWPVGLLGAFALLLLPLPAWLLDSGLALLIAFATLVLVTALAVDMPRDFAAFPQLLLSVALARLSLSLVATRLILLEGYRDPEAAGGLIATFAKLIGGGGGATAVAVVGGLALLNLALFTKSGRRLDLAASLTTTAQERAAFGAVGTARKLLRGETLAGLLFLFINFAGGTIVAVELQDIDIATALERIAPLAAGCGLVLLIPAVLLHLAGGCLAGKAAAPVGDTSWSATTSGQEARDTSFTAALRIDPLRLELGFGLLALLDGEGGARLHQEVAALRERLAREMGVILPPLHIQDNLQLPTRSYVLRLKEIEAGRGSLRPDKLLVLHPRGEEVALLGEAGVDPAFGLPGKWCDPELREEALVLGYTVVDPTTAMMAQVTELLQDNLAELLSYADTQVLLEALPAYHQDLIGDLVPAKLSLGGLQAVLQNLLRERVSIRDLPTILEALAEADRAYRDVQSLTEAVRQRLARQITAAHLSPQGDLPLITLSTDWEARLSDELNRESSPTQLAAAPEWLQVFMTGLNKAFDRQSLLGEDPVLVTSPGLRPELRALIERFRPKTVVLSHREIVPRAKTRQLEQI